MNKKLIGILIGLALVVVVIIVSMMGSGDYTPIVSGIIDNKAYDSYDDLDAATKPTTLSVNENVFASVHYIESPTGKKYDVKWTLNDQVVKEETLEVVTDKQGALSSELNSDKLAAGKLQFSMYYESKEDALYTAEVTIE